MGNDGSLGDSGLIRSVGTLVVTAYDWIEGKQSPTTARRLPVRSDPRVAASSLLFALSESAIGTSRPAKSRLVVMKPRSVIWVSVHDGG
jgi:hypothetical protein